MCVLDLHVYAYNYSLVGSRLWGDEVQGHTYLILPLPYIPFICCLPHSSFHLLKVFITHNNRASMLPLVFHRILKFPQFHRTYIPGN